jgi:hypothetical protein
MWRPRPIKDQTIPLRIRILRLGASWRRRAPLARKEPPAHKGPLGLKGHKDRLGQQEQPAQLDQSDLLDPRAQRDRKDPLAESP